MTDGHTGEHEALKAGVIESLPELTLIDNVELRERCIDAWAMALAETEFRSIDEIPGSGNWDSPRMLGGRSQAAHLRGVTMMALGMARELEKVVGGLDIDYDVLIAAGLVHDLGKPYEFSPRNQERWRKEPQRSGWPALRHPVYGAHIALRAGLPEAVVNAVAGHSREGEFVKRSLETTILHAADKAFWHVLTTAGQMDSDDTSYLTF